MLTAYPAAVSCRPRRVGGDAASPISDRSYRGDSIFTFGVPAMRPERGVSNSQRRTRTLHTGSTVLRVNRRMSRYSSHKAGRPCDSATRNQPFRQRLAIKAGSTSQPSSCFVVCNTPSRGDGLPEACLAIETRGRALAAGKHVARPLQPIPVRKHRPDSIAINMNSHRPNAVPETTRGWRNSRGPGIESKVRGIMRKTKPDTWAIRTEYQKSKPRPSCVTAGETAF